MRLWRHAHIILSALLLMGLSSGAALAGNAARMAEMQKALNEEVLAKPFEVAKPVAPARVTKTTPRPVETPRLYRSPRLSLGWSYGYRPYDNGWRYKFHHRHHRRHRHHHHHHRRYW